MEERTKIVSGFIFIIPNEAVTKKNAMDGYWEAEKKLQKLPYGGSMVSNQV